MRDHEANVRVRYLSSNTCDRSYCLGRYLELLVERCLPKQTGTLTFSDGLATVYSSPSSRVLYTGFTPLIHTHYLSDAPLVPLSGHAQVIKFRVPTNGTTAKSRTISCRFISKEAAIDWCRVMAVYEATLRKEEDILEVLDLYGRPFD